MSTEEAAPPRTLARLDPFLYPSDTTFRFVLLVVAVLGASLFIYNALYFNVIADNSRDIATYESCLAESQLGQGIPQALASGNLDEPGRQSDAFQSCIAPVEQRKAGWILGGVGLVLVSALAFYLAYPYAKIRRGRLRRLTERDAPEVFADLQALSREAGLKRPPTFVWNPLRRSAGGLAFGHPGRHFVSLDGGLVLLHGLDRPAFRAVVLHELAHLRGRDVDMAYATLAIWWGYLAAGVVPYVLTWLDEPLESLWKLAWRLIALVAVVYLIRNSVLRAREVYADARAHAWDGYGDALRRVVARLKPLTGRRWRRQSSVHPEPALRSKALDDQRTLFSLGFWEALATGITATLAYGNVVTLLSFFSNEGLAVRWIAGLVFAPLAIGVVGLGLWRATYAALARGERPPDGTLPGIGLGLGFLLGQQLSFFAVVEGDVGGQGAVFQFEPLWALAVVVGLALLARWVVTAATLWIGARGPGNGRLLYLPALVVAAAALVVGLGWAFLLRDLDPLFAISREMVSLEHGFVSQAVWAGPEAGWALVRHPILLYAMQDVMTLPVLASLWAFPLAALLLRGRLRRRGLLLPLVVGLSAGALYWLAHLGIRLWLRASLPDATRELDEYRLSFFVWTLVLALVFQAVAALVTAALSQEHAGVKALFAAFLTGCLATAAILGLNLAFGGTIDSTFFWIVLRQVVNEGALLAIPAAGLGALVGYALRRARPARLEPAGLAR